MADIAVVQCVAETLTTVTETATAPAGDAFPITNPDVPHVLEFFNDAAGAVTVTIANSVAAAPVSGDYGKVEKADLSVSVAAGSNRRVYLSPKTLKLYLDANNKIQLTYGSPDVAFKAACLQLG